MDVCPDERSPFRARSLLCGLLVGFAGCGSGRKAVCGGSRLKAPVDLPIHWPEFANGKLTYTRQDTSSRTIAVDGYFDDNFERAHDEWRKGLEAEGFTIRSDVVREHDAEIAWKGEASSGRVEIRQACGPARVWIHITNRPA